ncbi:type IV pilus modification PilV family protein [Vibrio sp. VB16]|uniref:type IV pilus modification PilV family protein n=1 Tax=Vibrio sp. VB16 TaxID=2785746 RepID=UPI00189D457D|nr:prepilin-type N-terminal cleavage/methylation domain-containing protein [Vibrio sp. VB16]UGA54525.1 prepilin-type N-terminal cleavage/methylation domain-containing protein [Vibrio sp. VB16]
MAVNRFSRKSAGFTLIESIVAIVIIGIAMVTMTSFLFPQIQDSARSHYEVRASALANSLTTEILARGYDHNSDPDGGFIRCGENDSNGALVLCSTTLGPDAGTTEFDASGTVRKPENFNDVDDYIGCWYTNEASKANCTESEVGSLSDVLGNSILAEYPNFAANVTVDKVSVGGSSQFKKVRVEIVAGSYGSYDFVAHRGNY